MKEESINVKCVSEILKVLRKYKRSPAQVRYIFKRVRESGSYQVPNKKRSLPDFLNDTEISFILEKSNSLDKTTRLLIPLAIFTGLRISELRNMKIEDIDFNNYQIKIVAGKGLKDRYVPINNTLITYIKYYIDTRKKGFLFVKTNLTPYTIRALQKKIEKCISLMGINKKLSSHSLRHTYATLLRRRGMTLDKIQILMGHSSIKTTEIYAHIELQPIKEDYFKLMGV